MRKSDTILLDEIPAEIIAHWGFLPYEIKTKAPSVDRYSTIFEVECKNCNHTIVGTMDDLETMFEEGYYCPECYGTFNPILECVAPNEFAETNKAYLPDLDGEFAIMSKITEVYGYKPYRFKSIDVGKSVQLEHSCCSTIFKATPTMLFENRAVTDKFSGESMVMPYCPKCNPILENDGVSYGGSRFIEKLDTFFKNHGKEFPYIFSEEDVYRFKAYDSKMLIGCKYCGKKFPMIPNDLFNSAYESMCPFCHGKKIPNDVADKAVQETEVNMVEEKLQSVIPPEVVEETSIEPDPNIFFDAVEDSETPENVVEEESITQEEVFEETESISEVEMESEQLSSIKETSSEEVIEKPINPGNIITVTVQPNPVMDYIQENGIPEEPEAHHITSATLDAMFPETELSQDNDEYSYPEIGSVEAELAINSLQNKKDVVALHDSSNIEEFNRVYGDIIPEENIEYPISDEQESEDISESSQQVQSEGDYPLEYEPVNVDIPVPDFANPTPVTDEYDYIEDSVMTNAEPTEESFDEFRDSMHEIMEDLGVEVEGNGILEESTDDSGYETDEYLDEDSESFEDENSTEQSDTVEEDYFFEENQSVVTPFNTEQNMSFLSNLFGQKKPVQTEEQIQSVPTTEECGIEEEIYVEPSYTEEPLEDNPENVDMSYNETENQVDIIQTEDNHEVSPDVTQNQEEFYDDLDFLGITAPTINTNLTSGNDWQSNVDWSRQ